MCLQKKMILPGIMVRKNIIIPPKNNKVRNRDVNQIKDFFKWKKKRDYGKRCIVETMFYSINIRFGE